VPLRTGQIFCLTHDIIAIEAVEGKRDAIVIPSGNTVLVVRFPCTTDVRMAEALWSERSVVVFGQDLIFRAATVKTMSA
jgi:hypothetical protein